MENFTDKTTEFLDAVCRDLAFYSPRPLADTESVRAALLALLGTARAGEPAELHRAELHRADLDPAPAGEGDVITLADFRR